MQDTQVQRIVTSAFLGAPEPRDVNERRRVRVVTSELPVEQRVPQRLEQSLGRLVMQPARDTIARNSAADPAKPTWIRVPTGETTCAFCILLASRELGPNFSGYSSRERALFDDNGDRFHKGCDCLAVVRFPGDDPHVLSPRMREYQDVYQKGAANAGTRSDATKILAEMRKVLIAQDPAPATPPSDSRRRRERVDVDTRPEPQAGLAPPPPPRPPRPATNAAGDDPGEPQGWPGHVNGYRHPHRTPVWSETERVARQRALGDVVPTGEQLYQHEIEATERLGAIGENVRWIPRDTKDFLPTNDLRWTSNGGILTELKSTSTKYRTIREQISKAVVRAAAQGVDKTNFIIDIGSKTLKPGLRQALSRYNTSGGEARRIAALWLLTRDELVPIDLE